MLMLRFLAFCLAFCLSAAAPALSGDDVAALWATAPAPPAPEIRPVTLDAASSALLILDIEELTCNPERRPRCVESVPRIAALLDLARSKGMPVVYSLTPRGGPQTILPAVAPRPGEPVVQSTVDKFLRTDLEKILADKGIKTVVVTGTAAHGAALFTATAAAQRGLAVAVPVDCVTAESLAAEQAAVFILMDGPGTRRNTSFTRSDLVTVR